MLKERTIELLKKMPNDWQEEIHDAVFGYASEKMFDDMSEGEAKQVLRYIALREEIQGEENDLRHEALIVLYNAKVLEKIESLVEEVSEAYYYTEIPSWEDIQTFESDWRKHVLGVLDDLREYIKHGRFW